MSIVGAGAFCLALSLGESAVSAATLQLLSTIPLPGVKGRIDHLSVDVRRHRIFVAALGNDTVEIIDTAGSVRRTIDNLGEPQGLVYLPESDRLVIANGSAHRVDIVGGISPKRLTTIEGLEDADNVRRLPAGSSVLVGYGGGALRIIDPATGQSSGDIRLPGHPESFQVDSTGRRAYVNVPSAHAVVLVDVGAHRAIARWETPYASGNFRWRSTSSIIVCSWERARRRFCWSTTSTTATSSRGLRLAGTATTCIFDGRHKLLYVICGEGRVDVVRQESANHYVVEASAATAPGARTGLFVPEEGKLYVAAPARDGASARILVYQVAAAPDAR